MRTPAHENELRERGDALATRNLRAQYERTPLARTAGEDVAAVLDRAAREGWLDALGGYQLRPKKCRSPTIQSPAPNMRRTGCNHHKRNSCPTKHAMSQRDHDRRYQHRAPIESASPQHPCPDRKAASQSHADSAAAVRQSTATAREFSENVARGYSNSPGSSIASLDKDRGVNERFNLPYGGRSCASFNKIANRKI